MNINKAIHLALGTVSKRSAMVYEMTYRKWIGWCQENNCDPCEVNADNVSSFLVAFNTTHSTRQREMSALRKLSSMFAIYGDKKAKKDFEYLKQFRMPLDNLNEDERPRQVLSPDTVRNVLGVWTKFDNPKHSRNFAMLSTAFYTGIRLGELIALKWRDFDEEYGILRIRHGKGDQYREVTLYPDDGEDIALIALRAWREVQNNISDYECVNMFTPLRRGGNIYADKPITGAAMSKIIDETCERSGVEFVVHDARRTLATTLLMRGEGIKDVQEQMGHRNPATTIDRYVLPANARKRRDHNHSIYKGE